ncbi:MAG: hypothetical protein RMM58_05890 [Chloroflexota bacterium]|nr:hypothetical protein [Dehalococcoidia bacterium]MDW8253392.1 hypothetical protein [Chloroflexota bacterium]
MPNQSSHLAPPRALTVVATVTPAFLADFESALAPFSPPTWRVNYVVRNLGPAECPTFDVVLLVDGAPLERHRYPSGLDAGRALASYFRLPARLLDEGRATIAVRVESPSGVPCCQAAATSPPS